MAKINLTTGFCGRVSDMIHVPEHPDEGAFYSSSKLNERKDQNYGTNGETKLKEVATWNDNPSDEDVDNSPKSKKILTVNFLIVPFMFFHVLALLSVLSVRTSFFMDKACQISTKNSSEICGNLSAYPSSLNAVQQVASDYSFYVLIIMTVPSVIGCVFIGGWRNERFTKCRVLLALFGMLFMELGYLLSATYMKLPLYYVLIFTVPGGLFGGSPIVSTYTYNFVRQRFALEHRTLLYASLKVSRTTATICSSFFSGQLLKYFGYEAVISFSITSHLLCFIYILFHTKTSKSYGEQGIKVQMTELFSSSTFLENLAAFTKKRANNKRMELSLLVLSLVTLESVISMADNVLFLFCNKMFSWDYTAYSNVRAITTLVITAVTITASSIFTKILPLKDSAIGLLGTVSLMAQYLFLGFSNTERTAYIGFGMGSFQDLSMFSIISRLSKMVPGDEVGHVFAIAATMESMAPLLESLIATRLYNATIDIFSSFPLLFMAVLLLFPFGVFIWTFRRERTNDEEDQKKLLKTEENSDNY